MIAPRNTLGENFQQLESAKQKIRSGFAFDSIPEDASDDDVVKLFDGSGFSEETIREAMQEIDSDDGDHLAPVAEAEHSQFDGHDDLS